MELLILLSVIGIANPAQAIKIVRQFIANAPFEKIKDAFTCRDEKEWNELLSDSNYTENFKQRALNDQAIFDYFYNYLTETQKRDWLFALLDTDSIRGMKKIEDLDLKVPYTEDVVKKLLTIAEKVDVNNRLMVYTLCDKHKFSDSQELLQQACENTKNYLTAFDLTNQKFGFDLLKAISSFSDEHKREILRSVISWLSSLQPPQIYQPYAISTVLHFWNILNEQQLIQKNFSEYIFKLLLTVTSIDEIKVGTDTLIKIRPTYNDFPKYYDDLKHKIDTEQNVKLKEILLKGLKELRETMGAHSGWWNWIDSTEENKK